MGGLTPGVTRITLRDLATMMIAVSDNSATNVLIDRVGMENVNALLDSLGLVHTRLRRKMMDLKAASEGRENISTPGEMMTLLEDLYRGKVLNKEMTDDFFTMLSTHKNGFITRDLPEGLKVANKPGELEGVRNDSACGLCGESSVCDLCDDDLLAPGARRRGGHRRISPRQPIECSTGWRGPANTGAWSRRETASSRWSLAIGRWPIPSWP